MKILVDTHSLVWFAFADPKITETAMNVIADTGNEILVSPASYWEIAIKVALGKWKLLQPYEELIDTLWRVYGFQILPILPSHTARLIELPFEHNDPFDRLLAAQALMEGVPLVSADTVFDKYGVSRIWF